ncbi:ATP-dependent RNA helicase DHH1-like [Tripterygium wilfordii]|uniref:ATP-dependent RNA helicase DHH1-like n=1 Tax=Tripterygium wilfordii TaxID=458696 RepID=UPI0018F84B93|nr:ATP-dependent RNA helicase DHH1-like [Tripterygium wilfordii]
MPEVVPLERGRGRRAPQGVEAVVTTLRQEVRDVTELVRVLGQTVTGLVTKIAAPAPAALQAPAEVPAQVPILGGLQEGVGQIIEAQGQRQGQQRQRLDQQGQALRPDQQPQHCYACEGGGPAPPASRGQRAPALAPVPVPVPTPAPAPAPIPAPRGPVGRDRPLAQQQQVQRGGVYALGPEAVPTERDHLGGYYRRFIEGFSRLAAPMTQLTRKDTPFVWSDECEQAFLELKTRLTSPPVLVLDA